MVPHPSREVQTTSLSIPVSSHAARCLLEQGRKEAGGGLLNRGLCKIKDVQEVVPAFGMQDLEAKCMAAAGSAPWAPPGRCTEFVGSHCRPTQTNWDTEIRCSSPAGELCKPTTHGFLQYSSCNPVGSFQEALGSFADLTVLLSKRDP